MNEINQINNEPVRKSRILLVDDEPGLRTAVKTFLEDEGFEIFIAVDGEDGWEKAQTIFPDLIISDVHKSLCYQLKYTCFSWSKTRKIYLTF